MKNKYQVGYIITLLMDYILTFGGSAGIIIYNYVSEQNTTAFKITITGIILAIAVLYVAKKRFERSYQNKENVLLADLASATSEQMKVELRKKVDAHHLANDIYQKLTDLLPLLVLYFVTHLGAQSLADMHGTIALLLVSVGAGSICSLAKKPLKEKAKRVKAENGLEKNK